MKSYYILADYMNVARPALVEKFRTVSVNVVADTRNVVRQRVKPDVNDVFRIKIYGNTPLKRSPRYAKILKPR